MAKQIVDFTGSPDDSNNRDESSILPIQDGENVAAEVFNRPHQVLRARTETLRSEVEALKYLVDADRALLLACDGNLTVDATASSFSIPAAKTLVVRPFVGPGTASARAAVTVPTTSGSGNYLLVSATNALRAYGRTNTPNSASSNDFSLEVIVGTAFNVTVSGTPARRVTITVVSGETTGDLETRLNNNAVFTAAGLVASAVGTNLEAKVTTMARTAFSGGLDAEKHSITSGGLAGFFAVAENKLADGDTLAIAYDALVNSTGGGRRQSIEGTPETKANVDVNLVNLRLYPAKATHAIPVCTREGSALVFIDGTRIAAGKSGALGGSGLEQNGGSIAGSLALSQNLTVGGTAAFTGAVTGSTVTTTGAGTFGSAVVNPATASTVGLTVNSSSTHSVDLSQWYSGTTLLATVSKTGSVHSNRFDTLAGANQVLALGTVEADSITIGRTNVTSTVKGTAVFEQGAEFTGKIGTSTPYNIKSVASEPTTRPLMVQGAAGQSVPLQEWRSTAGAGTTLIAQVTATGEVYAPGFDAVNASDTLRLASANAAAVTVGRAGITTTVASDLVIDGTTTVNDDVTIVGPAGTVVPLTVKGAASNQTANLQEWRSAADSSTAVASVNNVGMVTTYTLQVNGTNGANVAYVTVGGLLYLKGGISAGYDAKTLTVGTDTQTDTVHLGSSLVRVRGGGANPTLVTGASQAWYKDTNAYAYTDTNNETLRAKKIGKIGDELAIDAKSLTLTDPLAISEGGTGLTTALTNGQVFGGPVSGNGLEAQSRVMIAETTETLVGLYYPVNIPSWATNVYIRCVGGGGAGGSGGHGYHETAWFNGKWSSSGGAGGGGGGMSEGVFHIATDFGNVRQLWIVAGRGGSGPSAQYDEVVGTQRGFYGVDGERGYDSVCRLGNHVSGTIVCQALGGAGGKGGIDYPSRDTESVAGGAGGDGEWPGCAGGTAYRADKAGAQVGSTAKFAAGGGGAGGGLHHDLADQPRLPGAAGGVGGRYRLESAGGAAAEATTAGVYRSGGAGVGGVVGGGGGGGSVKGNGGAGGYPGGGGGGGGSGGYVNKDISGEGFSIYTPGAGGSGGAGKVIVLAW